MMDKLHPEWQEMIAAIAGLFPMAALARFLVHKKLAESGHRPFWGRELLWELPVAIFCAVLGGGAASYWWVEGPAAWALVGAVSWMGPRGFESLTLRHLCELQGKSPGALSFPNILK